jgi:hypothetical protein
LAELRKRKAQFNGRKVLADRSSSFASSGTQLYNEDVVQGTGHCSLNEYVYRFGIEESSTCECNNEIIETVDHFSTRCPRYERERAKLMRNIGVGGMWVDELLGDVEKIRHTMDYISSTKSFTF